MKRLDGPINVEFVNKTFFPNDHNVSEINKGRCFVWAYIAYRLYKDAQLYDYGTHAFVRSKTNRRYYDSERSNGEKSWLDLPATNFGVGCGCHDCKRPARPIGTATRFKEIWFVSTLKYRIDWKEVYRQIEKVLCEQQKL